MTQGKSSGSRQNDNNKESFPGSGKPGEEFISSSSSSSATSSSDPSNSKSSAEKSGREASGSSKGVVGGNGSGRSFTTEFSQSHTRDKSQQKESVMEKRGNESKSGRSSNQSFEGGSSDYSFGDKSSSKESEYKKGTIGSSNDSSSQFKRDAEEIKQQALSLGEQFVEQTSDQFFSLIDDQKEVLRDEVKSFVKALRQASSKLKEEDHTAVAGYTDRVGDTIEQYMNKLASKNANEVVSDIEDFARSKPVVFIAGALIGGFIFSRFMKSGSGRKGHHDLSEEWEAQRMLRGRDSSVDNGGPGLHY